jgi:hypothetical protein
MQRPIHAEGLQAHYLVLGLKRREKWEEIPIDDHLPIIWKKGAYDKGLRLHLHHIWPRLEASHASLSEQALR